MNLFTSSLILFSEIKGGAKLFTTNLLYAAIRDCSLSSELTEYPPTVSPVSYTHLTLPTTPYV